MSQADIEKALRRGSNFENSKLRIWEIYQTQPDRKLRAKALAKEYAPHGPGGCSHTYLDGSSGWLDHDSKGLTFEHYPDHQKIFLRWNQVEKYIDLMMQADRYLTDKEKSAIELYFGLNADSAAEYNALKEQYPDALVGFEQNGQFEFYGEDARKICELTGGKLLERETALGTVLVTGFPREQWAHCAKQLWECGENIYLAGLNEDGTHHQTKYLRKEDYLPVSSIVHMEGREFRVDKVDFDKDSVTLQDMALADLRMPIFREAPLAVVRELYEQEPEPPVLASDGLGLPGEDSNKLPVSIEVNEVPTTPEAAAAEEGLNEEGAPEPAGNFRITDEELGAGGPKQKFARNIKAIKTLFTLEQEHRGATAEEQQVLSQYVGWGGLADAFDPDKSSWAKEYAELKGLLSEEEYKAARGSVLNAHYTSPTVIRAIYDAVERMGFRTGNILEPSMGVGNFFGMLPESMADSRLYGVELDSITGRIAQKLYPDANIKVAGFETTDRRDFYDLAVGNVPFGNYKVNDKAYSKLNFSIHNYFFAKAIDQVRPGGIVAFVTSRYTLDSKDSAARKHIAERADLLGAIRLPNNAFRANAGTDVVSDIIFLQKRDRPMDHEPAWVQLGKTADGIAINSYFADHPEMILGGLTATPERSDGEDMLELFQNVAHKMDLKTAVERGVLVPIRCIRVKTNIDLTDVRINGIKYNSQDLESKLFIPERNRLIVDTYLKYVNGKKTVIFCASVDHAAEIAKLLRDNGVKAEAVSGRDRVEIRDKILKDYETGSTNVLCACDLLNEGWDSPHTTVLFMARPTMSKTIYMQQLGRGTRRCHGKDDLLVIDFVDNANMFNMPYSLHRVLDISKYQPMAYVLAPENKRKLDQDMLFKGEKPEAWLDVPIDVDDYEIIDLFNWQNSVKDMISQIEFVRMVDVQSETVDRYIKDGKIKPDLSVPFGDKRMFHYFREESVRNIAKQYGWDLITPQNMADKFMKFIETMDMSFSYKPVLLKAIYEYMDSNGRVALPDVVDYFIDFYEDRKAHGMIAEKPNSIYQKGGYTKKDVEKNILSNPFKRFEDMRFLMRCKDVETVEVNPIIFRKLTREDWLHIVDVCDKSLEKYYLRIKK